MSARRPPLLAAPGRTAACLALGLVAVLAHGCGAPAAEEPPRDLLSPIAAMVGAGGRAAGDGGFARALAPYPLTFPRDHGSHPEFEIEWWYFTGNLTAAEGRRFGFQLTFFRRALAPPSADRPPEDRASAWAADQLFMAHFALSDVDGGSFAAFERFSRGAAELAGVRTEPFRVWLDDWGVAATGGGFTPLRLRAAGERGGERLALDLTLDADQPPVLQGDDGLSRKGPEPGQASHYYSLTRIPARGTVHTGNAGWDVSGAAWLDHEWSTGSLASDQVGWDWFALQLADGRDLMFFQLRQRDGSVEPLSHGVLVTPAGERRYLDLADVDLAVLRRWQSPQGIRYPAGWRLRIPSAGLDLTVDPLLADQELDLSFRYWEGAVAVRDTATGAAAGRGYVELVGYGAP